MDEQLEFLKSIVSRLESAGIPYMLTGSMAMAVYAAPRMTRDLDIVIECGLGDVARIAKLFQPDCYADEGAIRDAVIRKSIFNVIHNEWIIKADFIVRKDEKYRLEEFRRRRPCDVEGTTVYVTAPEDLILSKLIWARDSDSELHLRDVRTIITAVGEMDWVYLENWAAQLGLSDMLGEVRRR